MAVSAARAECARLLRRAHVLLTLARRNGPRELQPIRLRVTRIATPVARRLEAVAADGRLDVTPLADDLQLEIHAAQTALTSLGLREAALLGSFSEADRRQTRLLRQLATELGLEQLRPVACAMPSRYFQIWPDIAVVVMPAIEHREVLTWPILAHEFGHAVYARSAKDLTKPFATVFAEIVSAGKAPEDHLTFRRRWQRWANELVADWVGTYTFGSLYLRTMIDTLGPETREPDKPSMTHPPVRRRIDWVVGSLTAEGDPRVGELAARWQEMRELAGAPAPATSSDPLMPDELVKALRDGLDLHGPSLGLTHHTHAPLDGLVARTRNVLLEHDEKLVPFEAVQRKSVHKTLQKLDGLYGRLRHAFD